VVHSAVFCISERRWATKRRGDLGR